MDKKSYSFQFSHFELNTHLKTLHNKPFDTKVDISLRGFELLELLCTASPEAISKEKLISALWPSSVVSEHSLARLISDTRQALGDNGDAQQIIKTHRGIGFCIPEVKPIVEKANDSKPENNPSQLFVTRKKILFVMLFTLICGLWIGYQNHQKQLIHSAIERISAYQDNTYTAFMAQVKRRNELVKMLEQRLGIKRDLQYEKFFAQYSSQFNLEEQFVCQQIRAITNTGLLQNNQAIIDELKATPQIFALIPKSKQLQQHLTFWLNKYQSIFIHRPDMCLVYVGVEDGVPYPSDVDKEVKFWLEENH